MIFWEGSYVGWIDRSITFFGKGRGAVHGKKYCILDSVTEHTCIRGALVKGAMRIAIQYRQCNIAPYD